MLVRVGTLKGLGKGKLEGQWVLLVLLTCEGVSL